MIIVKDPLNIEDYAAIDSFRGLIVAQFDGVEYDTINGNICVDVIAPVRYRYITVDAFIDTVRYLAANSQFSSVAKSLQIVRDIIDMAKYLRQSEVTSEIEFRLKLKTPSRMSSAEFINEQYYSALDKIISAGNLIV